jgi:hypothetical protein
MILFFLFLRRDLFRFFYPAYFYGRFSLCWELIKQESSLRMPDFPCLFFITEDFKDGGILININMKNEYEKVENDL